MALVFLCVQLLTAGGAFAAAKVIFVNPTGTGLQAERGTSWAKGFATIEEALFAAKLTASAAQPVEIWIRGGTYRPSITSGSSAGFRLISHVRLMGGFDGSETSADARNGTATTVLSADVGQVMLGAVNDVDQFPSRVTESADNGWQDNVSNVIVGDRVTDVLLDGLTITGGSATTSSAVIPQLDVDGMGMFASTPGDTGELATTVVPLSNLVAGGGLFFTAPARVSDTAPVDLTIIRCRFTRNRARGYGGAIAVRDAVVDLSNSMFLENRCDLKGGAISALNSTVYADATTFTSNFAASSGGGVDLAAYPTLKSVAAETDAAFGSTSGPGSDQDKIRVNLGYVLTGVMSINKGISVSVVDGGVGARIKEALPTNPFGKNLNPGQRFLAGYALFQIGVTLGDQGVSLAKVFGADPNNVHIKNWESFSYNFNTYATPQGLVSLGITALVKEIVPNLEGSYAPDLLTRTAWKRLQIPSYNNAPPSYFVRCKFYSNTTNGQGGALFNLYANAWIEQSWFGSNSAATTGGAIATGGYTTPRVMSSVFWGNKSENGHSAIANADHSRAQILNCTFYQNVSGNNFGFAVSAERGSSVRVASSVFWGNTNTLAENASGGADVIAATRDTLDADTKALYDKSGGDRVDWIGTMQLKNCNIQSLARLPIGSPFYPLDVFPNYKLTNEGQVNQFLDQYYRLDAVGDTELAGIVISGEGMRYDIRDPRAGNFSLPPVFDAGTVNPSASSPLIDKGSDAYLYDSVFNNIFARPKYDVYGFSRRVGASVDVGAVEAQPAVVAQVEVAQAGNPDWTLRHVYVKTVATGDGSGSSWANATDKLAVAMNSIAAEVWVAAGIYKPAVSNRNIAFQLANGTKVYGGFAGTETKLDQRNWRANQTIFSGDITNTPANVYDNSKHLVTCADVGPRY